MTERSYRPGHWYAVLAQHVVLLLPDAEKHRVPGLWSLVDDGAGFDEVLDALLADGLRTLSGFALVGRRDPGQGAVTALLRGPVAGSFRCDGEVVAVVGTAATTWVERSFPHLEAMSLVADATAAGPDLPVGDGLVRVARVDQPAVPAPAAPAAADPATRHADPASPGPLEEPLTEPVVVLPDPDGEWSPHAAALPPVPPPPGPPPAGPPPPYPADHDGLTGIGLADPLPEPPPGPPAARPAVGHPVARLEFSHGESVDVDRPVVIGRAPQAARTDPDVQPRLVPVPSPHQEISATHVEIRPGSGADHGLAVATDLGSTNGTVVMLPGLAPEALRPGIPVQLLPGSVLDLGDGVSVRVTGP